MMDLERLIADIAGLISIVGGSVAGIAYLRRFRPAVSRRSPLFVMGCVFLLVTMVIVGGLVVYPRLPHSSENATKAQIHTPLPTATPISLLALPSAIVPTMTRIANPTALPTSTPLFVVHVLSSTTQLACLDPSHINTATLTLDDTGSTAAVRYSITISDTLPNSPIAWASAIPTAGIMPMGAIAKVAIHPNVALCTNSGIPNTGIILHVHVDSSGSATTFSYTILPYRKPL